MGTQVLDRAEGIVEKMGLDLAEHDQDALPGFQVVLMLPHELQVQPDIVKYAADDDGHGQKSDRLRERTEVRSLPGFELVLNMILPVALTV